MLLRKYSSKKAPKLRQQAGKTRTYLSKSSEEDNETGELDKAEEVLGMVLPADEDATLPLFQAKKRSTSQRRMYRRSRRRSCVGGLL